MNIENETLKKKLISKNAVAENIFSKIFFLSALISIMSLIVIIVFVFVKGVPAIMEIGLMDFLFGKLWRPSSNDFGILPMILGSISSRLFGASSGFLGAA